METYDIGVARNHNFFADGILIHNCQHDAASSMAHLHSIIQSKWILGLSATPFRCDQIKLCFDKVVTDAGIHQLIKDGYLSPFDHYTIPSWDVGQVAESPRFLTAVCTDGQRYFITLFLGESYEAFRVSGS